VDRSEFPVTDDVAAARTRRADGRKADGGAAGSSCLATVVVPAHNEAAVIGRCLRILLSDARPGELDVVVVSNGSSDGTGDRARSTGEQLGLRVIVLELPAPGKVAALRTGLAQVRHWPVIVLDADCELPTATARALAAALNVDVPAVASAHMTVDTEESAPLVRGFYRTWTSLRYVRDGMVGSGVFALNEAGYSRLGAVPDVTNDDGWVRRSFAPAERLVVAEPFVAHAARTTRALVSRRARIVNGNRELDVDLGADPGRNSAGGLATSVRQGRVRPADAVAFLLVAAATRWVAATRRLRGDRRWGTDTTSRVPA
jgi:glycosyltransferase involved in cell wall biosynthesis